MEFFPFDAEYLRRLIAGEPSVEEHFVDYFTELLRLKLRKRAETRAVIDEVTQETFLRVFAKLRSSDGIRKPEGLGAFVCSVCSNVLRERYRETRRVEPLSEKHEEIAQSGDDLYLALVSAEDRDKVRVILSQLSERDARVLRAIFIEEQPKDDICAQMNVDRKYLRVLVHRAKNDFRRKYLKKKNSAPPRAANE